MKAKSKSIRVYIPKPKAKPKAKRTAKRLTEIEIVNRHIDLKGTVLVAETQYNVADNRVEEIEDSLADARADCDEAYEVMCDAEDNLRAFEEKYQDVLKAKDILPLFD